jgi:folylpolyglutamate synthase
MKANRPCFSVTQPFEAWEVFKTRAKEKSATIEICRSFEDYKWPQHAIKQISNFGQHQKLNISLALQLAKTWLWETKLDFLTEKDCNGKVIVPKSVEKSILTTHWPGRNQILKKGNLTYYLDGAHTRKSIEVGLTFINLISPNLVLHGLVKVSR